MADDHHLTWRRSSRSGTQGNCVEVAMTWRKSSRSGTNGDCVEVATTPDRVLVRDSKDPHGPRLALTPTDWQRFLTHLHR
jgi:hypothetical protein